jgi:hypothetical protein
MPGEKAKNHGMLEKRKGSLQSLMPIKNLARFGTGTRDNGAAAPRIDLIHPGALQYFREIGLIR